MRLLHTILLSLIATAAMAAPPKLDERPAADQEWGYRPASGSVSEVTPPNFSWRPQKGVVRWEMQCAPSRSFKSVAYRGEGIAMNVHTPAVTLPSGDYVWRYRGFDEKGVATKWSQVRSFEIANSATEMPMPPRKELLARIPNAHPRLFMRPEDMPRLKNLAQGRMKEQFEALVAKCERLLKNPPPTAEPPKYGPMVVRNSDEWRKIWWGNRTY
ncbi:MAG: hypothetical protein CMJ48_02115, partial [Planctomycetaceae bacterium]|nr:hypothetical protein [Planctomycetaceae bacterium]